MIEVVRMILGIFGCAFQTSFLPRSFLTSQLNTGRWNSRNPEANIVVGIGCVTIMILVLVPKLDLFRKIS